MELLVVIGIIGLLAALLTPAVMNARASARNASIKAEIDMLHMAIMNYKNEYGSFPPSNSTLVAASPMVRHLQRLFPRCPNVPNHVTLALTGSMSPDTALGFWLLGYTNDPTSPLLPKESRKKLFDFDASRNPNYRYWPSKLPNSPFIYVDNTAYGNIAMPAVYTSTSGQTYQAEIQSLPNGPAFFNADTFQILCAGADGVFPSPDDLSNFWPGTRQQYLDNLQSQ